MRISTVIPCFILICGTQLPQVISKGLLQALFESDEPLLLDDQKSQDIADSYLQSQQNQENRPVEDLPDKSGEGQEWHYDDTEYDGSSREDPGDYQQTGQMTGDLQSQSHGQIQGAVTEIPKPAVALPETPGGVDCPDDGLPTYRDYNVRSPCGEVIHPSDDEFERTQQVNQPQIQSKDDDFNSHQQGGQSTTTTNSPTVAVVQSGSDDVNYLSNYLEHLRALNNDQSPGFGQTSNSDGGTGHRGQSAGQLPNTDYDEDYDAGTFREGFPNENQDWYDQNGGSQLVDQEGQGTLGHDAELVGQGASQQQQQQRGRYTNENTKLVGDGVGDDVEELFRGSNSHADQTQGQYQEAGGNYSPGTQVFMGNSNDDDTQQTNGNSFSCKGRSPGFYADRKSGCKDFYRCVPDHPTAYKFSCGPGTLFDGEMLVCNFPNQVTC